MIDWKEEEKILREIPEYLKIEQGQHDVLFVDNGIVEEKKFPREDGAVELKTQIKFAVKYKGDNMFLSVNKSVGYTSLYGQLAVIGANYGTLVDKEVTILVQGKHKDKRYTIPQAITILESRKQAEREKKGARVAPSQP